MSKGLGRVQRQILTYFDTHISGFMYALLPDGYSRSDYQAALRAVHRLQALGHIEVVKLGNSEIVVCASGKTLHLHDLRPDLCATLETEQEHEALVTYVDQLLCQLEQADDPARTRPHADALRAELHALGIDGNAVKARQAARQADRMATLMENMAAREEEREERQQAWYRRRLGDHGVPGVIAGKFTVESVRRRGVHPS